MTSLDGFAAQEWENHHPDESCCHDEDRVNVDTTARLVCVCGCSMAAHRIDTKAMPCDTGGCACRGYRWCHDVTTTRSTAITDRRTVRETP